MVTAVDFPECYTSIDAASIRAVNVDNSGRPGQIEVETFFNISGYALDHQIVRTNGQASP